MRKILSFLAVLLLAATASAQAEWREARTDHFVLTIDDTEQGARDFAMRLERFDRAMRKLYSVRDNPDQHLRPIAIYAMKMDLYNQVCGCPGTLGYYRPRAEGSFIFTMHVPDVDRKSKTGGWSSQALLLHEYSHHFTFSNFPIAYPYWFAEGFAEFNANTAFEDDGSIVIGYPANYRAEALLSGSQLSSKQMFDPQRYGFSANVDLVYGRGWLLTHYLMLNPARSGQLSTYLAAMNKGTQSLEAAESAFGDLKKLNAELDLYKRSRIAAPLRIPPPATPPTVTVTLLPPGQAEMLPVRALMLNGVNKGFGLRVATRAGRVASKYPDDAEVQEQLAAAEFLAARYDRADEAADKALKLKPDMVDALMRKGLIALMRARDPKAPDPAMWATARAWFLKANRADPNAVAPLYLYYLSFVQAKAKPTPGAIKGLMRAEVLAPESSGIRMALGRQMLFDGDAASARALLQPVAFSPHQLRAENLPRQVIDLIDAGKIEEAKAAFTKSDEKDEEDD
jgi:tetratricopeptide (TPR) repeat protein